MSQGLAALAAGRTTEARSAFNKALALRPGDAGARSGLEQLDGDERRERLTRLQAEAEGLAAAERWAEAADRFRELQALDPTLAAAKNGLATAEARAAFIAASSSSSPMASASMTTPWSRWREAVVRDAGAVPAPGPVLSGQVARLKSLIAAAARPVTVQIESDNQTSVVIYKVGALGIFTNRTIELRPGSYVIVGTRDGYRDVRRNVRISADGSQPPISVRCEEPI